MHISMRNKTSQVYRNISSHSNLLHPCTSMMIFRSVQSAPYVCNLSFQSRFESRAFLLSNLSSFSNKFNFCLHSFNVSHSIGLLLAYILKLTIPIPYHHISSQIIAYHQTILKSLYKRRQAINNKHYLLIIKFVSMRALRIMSMRI